MSSTAAAFREVVLKNLKKGGRKVPAKSAKQYGLSQGVCHGSITGSKMPKDVACEMVHKTPAKTRKTFARALTGSKPKKAKM